MSEYVINFTNSNTAPIIIQEDQMDTSTDITLFGRTTLQYGAEMNQNMLSLLEKFACPENQLIPGIPNYSISNGKLSNPIVGEMWYNSTQNVPFVWNGTHWISLLSSGSIASNWGLITNNQQIPQPVADNGYVFQYSECVWIVGPFTMDGVITDFTIDTSSAAVVTAEYNGTNSLVVSYLIVGIKGNLNNGTLTPVVTPTMTPTVSVTPSSTQSTVNLPEGLVSFWEFNESGSATTYVDCVGTNNWTRTGDVATSLPPPPPYGPNNGVVGNAIQAGASTWFTVSPTAGITGGANAQYTFGGWFKINPSFISYSNIFQRGIFGTPGQRSFTLTYTLSSDSLTLFKSQDGSAYEFLNTPVNIGLNNFGWHFVVAWVDGIGKTLNIQIDNGQIYTTAMEFGATFNIGNLSLGSSTGIPLQSAVDQLFFYSRLLNTAELNVMYNAGEGITCAQASGLITPTPTPTITPTLSPPPTPTLNALTVSLNTSAAIGSCTSGNNCTAITNTVSASVIGGVAPYTYNWVFVPGSGTTATVTSPTTLSTTFSRQGTNQTLTGYYRLQVTDSSNYIVYSAIVEVQTTHS